MTNSPSPLIQVLHDPVLITAELARRRARTGTDQEVLAWVEATFGVLPTVPLA